MTEPRAADPRQPYLDEFSTRRREPEPEPVTALRQRSIEQFAELGFPTRHQEEWRYTNLESIAATRYRFATGPKSDKGLGRSSIEPHLLPDCAALVFIDGRFAPAESRLDGLPEGVVATSLCRALAVPGRTRDLCLEHLGRYAPAGEHPFAALNAALFADGPLVVLGRGVVLERPLQLLHLSSGGTGEPLVSFPRTLIIAETSSEGTVIESYAGPEANRYLTCRVSEVIGLDNSTLRHYRLQKEGGEASHLAIEQVYLERSATLFSNSFSWGGALTRNDIGASLAGEGIDCTLNGLYVLGGSQHLDTQMRVEHRSPHCSSHELYKGVLDDAARAIFNGRIYVHAGAQKTDAKQTNRNLLLSERALVQSNPQLEIFADDVRCTHGSTTGQLDPDALFYLRSRGLDRAAARSLLTWAFTSELVKGIEIEPLRREVENALFTRLPGGDLVRQAV